MQIHQTLHGYKNGHQLLGASLPLPTATQNLMLSLSDLSGSSGGQNILPYLTAYPIAEIKSYALARTWYAPEMKRPGCVWTHTLLVPFSEVAQVKRGADLLSRFRRPNQDFEVYEHPIQVSGQTTHDEPSIGIAPVATITSLENIYLTATAPCVIASSFPQELEGFVLELWSQQWSRLRRNFCFCTLSLAPRQLNGRPFDLQVIPRSSEIKFQRELPDANLLFLEGAASAQTSAVEWIRVAALDLQSCDAHSPLRQFLERFGVDVVASRSSFVPLVETFFNITFDNAPVFPKLLNEVAQRFPMPQDAAVLKQAMFGPPHLRLTGFLPFMERQVLAALATTNNYQAFDKNALFLRDRATAWTRSSLQEAGEFLSLILKSYISPFAEQILKGVLEGVTVDNAIDLANEHPQLLPLFVSNYPTLATLPRVWEVSLNRQQELLDSLYENESVPWRKVVGALLDADVDVVAPDVLQHLGPAGVQDALNWLVEEEAKTLLTLNSLPGEWRRVLAQYPTVLLEWLDEEDGDHIESIAFVATLLNSRAEHTLRATDRVWSPLAKRVHAIRDGELLATTATFLLSLAFDNDSNSAAEIAMIAFPIVHDAVAHERLSQACWRIIQGQIPFFEGYRNWDRCERLREALVNNARRFHWPSSALLRATRDLETFRYVVAYCKDTAGGREYLKTLRDQVLSQAGIATKQQAELLSRKNWLERLFP